MQKQCLTLLKHAMMLKQCLTLLKHSKTVALWADLSLFFLLNALWAVSKRSRALWADLSLSLSNALWAVSKRSRALWADLSLSLSNAFWAVSKSSRAFWAISLSHVSFELRDWLTRSLLGSLRRNSVTALYPTLGRLYPAWRSPGDWRKVGIIDRGGLKCSACK